MTFGGLVCVLGAGNLDCWNKIKKLLESLPMLEEIICNWVLRGLYILLQQQELASDGIASLPTIAIVQCNFC